MGTISVQPSARDESKHFHRLNASGYLRKAAKQTDMGDTSLYGNRGLIRMGGRSQGCAHSISKPDFQIPHRDLSRLGGTKSTRFFGFPMGLPTCSSSDENASLLCPPPPGDAAAPTPGPARRVRITIFPAFFSALSAPSVSEKDKNLSCRTLG